MTTHADVVLTATLAAAAGVTDRQELKRLDDSATIYKRAGPILVKQDLDMSKSTVKERIDFIKAQLCVASRGVAWRVVWRRVASCGVALRWRLCWCLHAVERWDASV